MSSGGRSYNDSATAAADANMHRFRKELKAARKSELIDNFTLNELEKGLSFSNLSERQGIFKSASKGGGIFKERKLHEEKIKIMKDQPGRKQTYLTGTALDSGAARKNATYLTGL